MKALLIAQDQGQEGIYGSYAVELLKTEGLNWVDSARLSEVGLELSVEELARYAIIVLTPSFLSEIQVANLAAYVAAGGRLISFRPCLRLGEAFGLKPTYGAQMGGTVSLNASHPIASGLLPARAGHLQLHGIADRWRLPDDSASRAKPVAWMHRPAQDDDPAPWLIASQHGQGGVCLVASDLPAVVAAIRQGDSQRANTLSGGLDGIYRPSELFVGHLDSARAGIPQADVYTALLANAIDWLIGHPTPRLWYYPSPVQRSALVMTSDDDWSTPAQFAAMIDALQNRDATCTFYLVPGSRLSPDRVEAWSAQGHAFSCHPDFSALTDAAEQDHQAYRSFGLEEQIRLFPQMVRASLQQVRGRFDVAANTIRQHAIRWQGYVDAARVLAAAGVGMETNYYSILPNPASHMTGSGRPTKFVDTNGDIVDVFQQPTMISEDTTIGAHSFAPHWSTEHVLDRVARIMDENLSTYYTATTVNIHPVSFADYAGDMARGIWDLARARQIPILSADAWLRFTRLRYATRIVDVEWRADALRFAVQTPPAPDGLSTTSLTIACSTHGRPVQRVTVDGIEPTDVEEAILWKRPHVLFAAGRPGAETPVEIQFGASPMSQ